MAQLYTKYEIENIMMDFLDLGFSIYFIHIGYHNGKYIQHDNPPKDAEVGYTILIKSHDYDVDIPDFIVDVDFIEKFNKANSVFHDCCKRLERTLKSHKTFYKLKIQIHNIGNYGIYIFTNQKVNA